MPADPSPRPSRACSGRTPALLIAALALLALGGCATLSETDCANGDWFAIGATDARYGHTSDRLAEHRQACSKYGLGVDPQAYAAGYQEGLMAYCTPRQAFALGHDGHAYPNQCPPTLARDLGPAWELGDQVRGVETELAGFEREIESLRAEINDAKTTDSARELAEQRLRYVKNDRERRERDRDRLLAQARRFGLGDGY